MLEFVKSSSRGALYASRKQHSLNTAWCKQDKVIDYSKSLPTTGEPENLPPNDHYILNVLLNSSMPDLDMVPYN